MKGWLRYWCCDSSGIGEGDWEYLYAPGINDEAHAFAWIIDTRESWIRSAGSHQLKVEIDADPPAEEVHIAIEHHETLAKDHARIAADLRKSIGLE